MRPDLTTRLRLRRTGAPRAPFVLLVIALLGVGLVVLLLVNTAMATGSFTERTLQTKNDALSLQKQQLERSVQGLDTPQKLAAAAARLGMVPGGDPAFVTVKGSTVAVVGSPAPATAPPPPTTTAPTTTAPTTPPPTTTAPTTTAPTTTAPTTTAPTTAPTTTAPRKTPSTEGTAAKRTTTRAEGVPR